MKLTLPPIASFALISVIWGLTWIAIKAGVDAVPPIFFAAMRYVAAGLLLTAFAWPRIDWRSLLSNWRALVTAALLMTALCHGPLFWGMQHLTSGVAAVVNLALIPPILAVLGAMINRERLGPRPILGIVIGTGGLLLLFRASLMQVGDANASGLAAIVAGTLAYCLGSVLSRRYLAALDVVAVSGASMLIGGVTLLSWSALTEPLSPESLAGFLSPGPLAGWAFLTLIGSIVAFTLYLDLLRRWGAGKAGLYAFVSPVVALIAGSVVLGEDISREELTASLLLMLAAAVAISDKRSASSWRT